MKKFQNLQINNQNFLQPIAPLVFPKIAIRSSTGPITVREREKVIDERIVQRTEEVPCPMTGEPQLRTVEYIEKVIETEVRRH